MICNKACSLFIVIFSIFFWEYNAFSEDIPTLPDHQFQVPDYREIPLNDHISPCDNFYEHVCSIENSRFSMPESHSKYIYNFNDSAFRIKNIRLKYIKSLLNESNLNQSNTMLKNFYQSCMNTYAREVEEDEIFTEFEENILRLNKKKILEKITLDTIQGEDYLFEIKEIKNIKNPKIKDIIIYYSLPLKSKEYYEDEQLMADYKDLIKEFFSLILYSNGEEYANFIINLEKSIAKTYPTKAKLREALSADNSITRQYLTYHYPMFNFHKLFEKIPQTTIINLLPKEAFIKLNEHLETANDLEIKALALWNKFSLGMIKYSVPDYYLKVKEFNHKHFGNSLTEEQLEKQCIQETHNHLGSRLDFEIIQKQYQNFPTKRIHLIIKELQKATYENIKNSKGMSEFAKKKALKKIENMKFQIVKPERIEDWDLEVSMHIDSKKFLKNKNEIKAQYFQKFIQNISLPINENLWHMKPLTVNAYYDINANRFFLPLGILQPPIFDETKSDIVNFGSLGVVVGHEIAHAFDDKGSKFNEHGILEPWMSRYDKEQFKKQANKMIAHFDSAGINGNLSVGENISDFLGIQNAFHAAFSNKNIKLQKEFFIQYAKIWCGVTQPKYKEHLKKIDFHAPGELRVNQQLKLSKNFYETFSCKIGDPMALSDEERFSIW